MHAKLLLWLVTAMLSWTLPAARHDAERDRYEAIAQDAVAVAFDAGEKPIYPGALGRTKTALMLLAIASYESGFRADVDDGTVRGDGGRSWCLMQVNLGANRILLNDDGYAFSQDTSGWSGKDLVQDRQRCFRTGLHLMRASHKACGNLSAYTSGRCRKKEPKAIARAARASAWFKDGKDLEWTDEGLDEQGKLALDP